ncbi:MAG TPA: FkbM family methyltransferase [Longimicrobium sp.]
MRTPLRSAYHAVVPRAIRSRIRRAAGLDELDLQWRLQSGLTLWVRGAADWYLYNEIFVDGEYDLAIDTALGRAPAGAPLRVLDLGANVGYFTLRLVHRLRLASPERPFHVTMVEGSPGLSREAAQRVVEANGLHEQVRLVHGLAGERSGSARLREGDFHPQNGLAADGTGTEVAFVDLDALLPAGEPIDLLKCDIEGSEERFAESYGALLGRVGTVVVELHPGLCDTDRCLALMRDAGLGEATVLREARETFVVLLTRPREDSPGASGDAAA